MSQRPGVFIVDAASINEATIERWLRYSLVFAFIAVLCSMTARVHVTPRDPERTGIFTER